LTSREFENDPPLLIGVDAASGMRGSGEWEEKGTQGLLHISTMCIVKESDRAV
jgi:hypothetical protein